MKRTATVAVALLAAASLLLAGSALAGSKTYKQAGQIVGDKGSEVKLRVKVKGGEPTQVKGFKAKDVITRCNDTIKRYDYESLSPIPLHDGEFKITLSDSSIGLEIKLKGHTKRHGKAVNGKISTNEFEVNGKTCKVSKQKFKTSI
ncbi:MAG: hypothetical protein BroJett022_08280 [Actinomycetes bacterium]|nr:MAG: hypothetical protein BroJett022_08280 [Actinomycetes bacterium]